MKPNEKPIITPHEFSILFKYLWYQDFPVDGRFRNGGLISDWTQHVQRTVYKISRLAGLYSMPESNGKFDSIMSDNDKHLVIAGEWEWKEITSGIVNGSFTSSFNEIKKLHDVAIDAQNSKTLNMCFLFCYTTKSCREQALKTIGNNWHSRIPLLVNMLLYRLESGDRTFETIESHSFNENSTKLLLSYPALPWQLQYSRWFAEN